MSVKDDRAAYMRQWRRDNTELQRLYMLAHRCKGDGWEEDPTDFVPETPHQSMQWARLLAGARP